MSHIQRNFCSHIPKLIFEYSHFTLVLLYYILLTFYFVFLISAIIFSFKSLARSFVFCCAAGDCKIFAIHFSYTYIQHPEYYSSLDYVNDLDNGSEPIDGSQYWVALIVQEVFDKYIKTEYKDVADYLVKKELMELK